MARMAPILGRGRLLQHFLAPFTALCADSLWQIRKICAANFGEFTSIVGTDGTEDTLVSGVWCGGVWCGVAWRCEVR